MGIRFLNPVLGIRLIPTDHQASSRSMTGRSMSHRLATSHHVAEAHLLVRSYMTAQSTEGPVTPVQLPVPWYRGGRITAAG